MFRSHRRRIAGGKAFLEGLVRGFIGMVMMRILAIGCARRRLARMTGCHRRWITGWKAFLQGFVRGFVGTPMVVGSLLVHRISSCHALRPGTMYQKIVP
jgi:hypothetical protein